MLLIAFLLMACTIAMDAVAETGSPKQEGDLVLQPLTKSLIISKERLSLAEKLAETVGVETLRRFVKDDERYAKRLGYDSLAQVMDGKLKASAAFSVFRIGLTQLRNYDGNVAMLMSAEGPNRFMVPISVMGEDKILSAITVRLTDSGGRDRVVQWGSKSLIRRLSEKRSQLNGRGIVSQEVFVIEIPAMNRSYLGYARTPGKVMLVPMLGGYRPTDRFNEQPMEEVLKALAEEVQSTDDNPR